MCVLRKWVLQEESLLLLLGFFESFIKEQSLTQYILYCKCLCQNYLFIYQCKHSYKPSCKYIDVLKKYPLHHCPSRPQACTPASARSWRRRAWSRLAAACPAWPRVRLIRSTSTTSCLCLWARSPNQKSKSWVRASALPAASSPHRQVSRSPEHISGCKCFSPGSAAPPVYVVFKVKFSCRYLQGYKGTKTFWVMSEVNYLSKQICQRRIILDLRPVSRISTTCLLFASSWLVLSCEFSSSSLIIKDHLSRLSFPMLFGLFKAVLLQVLNITKLDMTQLCMQHSCGQILSHYVFKLFFQQIYIMSAMQTICVTLWHFPCSVVFLFVHLMSRSTGTESTASTEFYNVGDI